MDLLAVGGVGCTDYLVDKKADDNIYFTIIYIEDEFSPFNFITFVKWKWRRACIKLEAILKNVFKCILSKTNVFKKLMLTVRGSRRSDN